MNKIGNFMWKLFSVTMVFLCHIGPDHAFAEESETTTQIKKYISDDPKMTSQYFTSTDDVGTKPTRSLQLCPSGYYLSSCGTTVLGTNWLYGMTKKGGIKTPDYYSYKASSSDTIHMSNLSKFFAHNQPITYTDKNGSENTVSSNEYKTYLNQMLSNYCTTDKGYISEGDIYCTRCPNNASVGKSTVEEDTYDTGLILWDSWNVHTIADCYLNKFTDSTGTYVYVADNIINGTTGTNCYYTTNVTGTKLYYK